MFKRRKDYIVTIIANNYKQDVQVKAEDKKTAESMVDNVLLGTNLFDFKNKCDYELKIRRKRCGKIKQTKSQLFQFKMGLKKTIYRLEFTVKTRI